MRIRGQAATREFSIDISIGADLGIAFITRQNLELDTNDLGDDLPPAPRRNAHGGLLADQWVAWWRQLVENVSVGDRRIDDPLSFCSSDLKKAIVPIYEMAVHEFSQWEKEVSLLGPRVAALHPRRLYPWVRLPSEVHIRVIPMVSHWTYVNHAGVILTGVETFLLDELHQRKWFERQMKQWRSLRCPAH